MNSQEIVSSILLALAIVVFFFIGYYNPSFYYNSSFVNYFLMLYSSVSVLVSYVIAKKDTEVIDILVAIIFGLSLFFVGLTLVVYPGLLGEPGFDKILDVILVSLTSLIGVSFGKKT